MKYLPKLAILAIAATVVFAAPAARADGIYGNLTVTVWTGNGVTDQANLASMPGGPATTTFNYSGPLDFTNNNCETCSNTFGEFFGSNASGISGLSSSALSTLLASTMSKPGFAYNSYLSFTGTYTGGGTVTASHDDGASLYTGSGYSNAIFQSAAPTSEIPSTGTLSMGTNVPFDLIYVESNGAPSDLVVTGLSPVPEPGSMGLMALGMIGIGVLAYRGSALNS